MAQATFSIRMDEKLKKEFDALCTEFGMNATTASCAREESRSRLSHLPHSRLKTRRSIPAAPPPQPEKRERSPHNDLFCRL